MNTDSISQLDDFTNPLAILRECHNHIMSFVAGLIDFCVSHSGQELTSRERSYLLSSISSLVTATALHCADEEVSLFASLARKSSDSHSAIRALEREHRAFTKAFEEIERIGQTWMSQGGLSPEDLQTLIVLLRTTHGVLIGHFETEETVIFPLIESVSSRDTLSRCGQEMALRRGLEADEMGRFCKCKLRRAAGVGFECAQVKRQRFAGEHL
jgi:hemerythrin-like domain-containing protein